MNRLIHLLIIINILLTLSCANLNTRDSNRSQDDHDTFPSDPADIIQQSWDEQYDDETREMIDRIITIDITDTESIPFLIESLDIDKGWSLSAASKLSEMGENVVDDLIIAAGDGQKRNRSLWALARIASTKEEVLDLMSEALKDEGFDINHVAIMFYQNIGCPIAGEAGYKMVQIALEQGMNSEYSIMVLASIRDCLSQDVIELIPTVLLGQETDPEILPGLSFSTVTNIKRTASEEIAVFVSDYPSVRRRIREYAEQKDELNLKGNALYCLALSGCDKEYVLETAISMIQQGKVGYDDDYITGRDDLKLKEHIELAGMALIAVTALDDINESMVMGVIDNSSEQVKLVFVYSIRFMPDIDPAVDLLMKYLDDPSPIVRLQATKTIISIPTYKNHKFKDTIPLLEKLIEADDWNMNGRYPLRESAGAAKDTLLEVLDVVILE